MHPSPRVAVALAVLATSAVPGCRDGAGPDPRPPAIIVEGVGDGDVVFGPVTLHVTVDAGTWEATLDGVAFASGGTVSAPGLHVLRVEARNEGRTASRTVGFEIRLGEGGRLVVRLLDLGPGPGGGGDALLLTDSTAEGVWHLLVDGGPGGPGGDDPAWVLDRLRALGVDTLEAIVISHPHRDHFVGLAAVLEGLTVRNVYHNGQASTDVAWAELLARADARTGSVIEVDQLVDFEFGATAGTNLKLVPPLGDHLGRSDASASEIHDGSLAVALARGAFRMFLAGDGERRATERWRRDHPALTGGLTALKLGAHGGAAAVFDAGAGGSSAWLDHTAPRLVLVSADGLTRPDASVVSALAARAGARALCTSVHGTVEIRVDAAGVFEVATERGGGAACVAGSGTGSPP